MLSLPPEEQGAFLKKVEFYLKESNQQSLANIVSKTLMPTKHRDFFARSIDVYDLQIKYCSRLLEEESFDETILENLHVDYQTNIQAESLEKLEKTSTELPEEEIAILNQASKWKPGKTPTEVQKELESLRALDQKTPVAAQKIVYCINLLATASFDTVFLEKIKKEYQSELENLFNQFLESFKDQIKHKDQIYDSEEKIFVNIQSKDDKNLQLEKFKTKLFANELPIYRTWKPSLTPLDVFSHRTAIEELREDASSTCETLAEAVTIETSEQSEIHQETRDKIFLQWSQERATLQRFTFSAYQQPYYNIVSKGSINDLKKRFKKDKIQDRLTYLKLHAPEILNIACTNNRLNMLRYLIEKTQMPQQKNNAGYYPIHYAVIGSKKGEGTAVLEYLLAHKADVNARGPFGYTPLHVAIMCDRLDLVIFLHQHGAHVDGIVEKEHYRLKPIHLASECQRVNIVGYLLQHGADPFVLNQERQSSLAKAILENNKVMIITFFRDGVWLTDLDRIFLNEHLKRENDLNNMPEKTIGSLLTLENDLKINDYDRSVLTEVHIDTLSIDNYLKGIWDEFHILRKKTQIYALQEKYTSQLLSKPFDPNIIQDLQNKYEIMIEAILILEPIGNFSVPNEDHVKIHQQWRLPLTPNEAKKQMVAYENDPNKPIIIALKKRGSDSPYETADPYETIQQNFLKKKLLAQKTFLPLVIEGIQAEYHTALQSIQSTIVLPEEPGLDMTFSIDLSPEEAFDLLEKRRESLPITEKNRDKLFVRATNLKLAFDLGTSESFLIQQQEKGEISQNKHPDYYQIFRLCVEQDLMGLEAWNSDWQDHLLEACPKAFHIACANNTLTLADALLGTIPIPMFPDEYGRYPIHYAMLLTKECRHHFIARLIHNNADINATDDAFWTPMHVACARDDLDLVKLLVTLGASLQGVKGYDTPLHVAASRNKPEVVRYLLEQPPEKKVHVSALNQNGHTPVGVALLEGHLNIVKLFIEQEHYLSVQDIHAKNDYDSTASHLACARGDLDLLTFLVGYDAPLQEANKDGDTPLHVGAFHNHPEVVFYLLKQRVDALALNQSDHTPLVSAILEGHLDVAKVFLEQGYWLRPQDKAILVAYLEHIAPIVCDSNLMAVTFKNISLCVTLEKRVMELIGYKLSAHPSLNESYEALLAPPVPSNAQEQSVPSNSTPTETILSTSETDRALSLTQEPITSYADQATALLYSAGVKIGAKIRANVPTTPTMAAALQRPLHYLYRSTLNPEVLTNSSNTTPLATSSPPP
ncbi:MAG: ankyrin repeat domain-containing protein [Gammaproteobacteria bacterium]|nr:ankyrin repeat domain-containing protein [Gammaproteobacteria bacterium]